MLNKQRFNRTFMELKGYKTNFIVLVLAGFNRTFMELKVAILATSFTSLSF